MAQERPPFRVAPRLDTPSVGNEASLTQRGRSPIQSHGPLSTRRLTRSLTRSDGVYLNVESSTGYSTAYSNTRVNSNWTEEHIQTRNVPEEVQTKQHIATAVATVLGVSIELIHEALKYGSDLLMLSPIVGLPQAAQGLLKIWDSLRRVNTNRRACLRLAERCATILIHVHESITGADNKVHIELQVSISHLVASFDEVDRYLIKLSLLSFFRRYLLREKIQLTLDGYHHKLTDALRMFSVATEIRILNQILHFERQRLTEVVGPNAKMLRRLTPASSTSSHSKPASSVIHQVSSLEHDAVPPEEVDRVRTQLKTVTALQNELDAKQDTQSLWKRIKAAIHTSSDLQMIRVLQIRDDEMPEAIETLQRALKVEGNVLADPARGCRPSSEGGLPAESTFAHASTIRTQPNYRSYNTRPRRRRADALHSTFMTTSLEALQRLSGPEVKLPSWTITEYEVDMEEEIGVGFFSRVYRGTWRDRTVAIKRLVETAPQAAFIQEMSIWKTLKHPNVLELLGASSTQSRPPWFFVSPYLANGSLVTYLKKLPSLNSVDALQMIHQIAKGMKYLHEHGILHGDLKAANVLVDDDGYCVISDFGQSEMKSEAYRQSGMHNPRGTFRWQAPEILLGQSQLTRPVDVYAFAITCTEVLTKGALPWLMQDDSAVRDMVVRDNLRPDVPQEWSWSSQFSETLHLCWDCDPKVRLPFEEIEKRLQVLLDGSPTDDSISDSVSSKSVSIIDDNPESDEDAHTHRLPAEEHSSDYRRRGSSAVGSTARSTRVRDQMTVDDADNASSHGPTWSQTLIEPTQPAPEKRQYRTWLRHQFHTSRELPYLRDTINLTSFSDVVPAFAFARAVTLPLWTPSHVSIGAVGYHESTNGTFISLFNSFDPIGSSGGRTQDIAPMESYGETILRSQQQGGRNVVQRMADVFWRSCLSSWGGEVAYLRRYSLRLHTGHGAAYMFTESTIHRYMEDITAPKEWFKAHVEQIVGIYGKEHRIARKDLCLVVGTLEARDYALFVSHKHPNCQVNFDVFPTAWTGQPWGRFSFERSCSVAGPIYDSAPVEDPQYGCKISNCGSSGSSMDTVLLARLRFEDGQSEPTSL
ncbi:hypothetical protein BC628DRAFT_1421313 [Trametes gibbosa]|nr:hypothetical protein BC628DRAFT_1421313 [Trametes gibbosa]